MNTTQHSSSTKKPHALAIPLPLQGHMHPLMEFSKKLISAGFMVTFANIEANHQKLHMSQKKTQNGYNVDGGDLVMVSLEEGFQVDQVGNAVTLVGASLSPAMKASIERLLARLQTQEHPITLLVCDFRLHFVHTLAERAGIPSVSFWTQNAANFACNLFVAQGFRPPPDDLTPITCVHGVPPFKRSEITGFSIAKVLPPFPSEEYGWLPFRDIHKPTWVVLNTFKELEATTLETVRHRLGFRPFALGPLVNASSFSVSKEIAGTDMDSLILQWLHHRPPASVLYVAFGTVMFLSEEQLEELVLGFEESRQCILWVFRTDLCRNSEKYTIDSLSRRLKKQGSMVVPWAPQWHILRHPAVGGFLTHCGWNSTLEGITAGVPMLAWPGIVDQFLTRRCLKHQWGIGMGFEGEEGRDGMAALRLKTDGNASGGLVSRTEVGRKVKELMQGERGKEMRERAAALGESARRAFEDGGSFCSEFSAFLQSYRSFKTGGP